jgi:DNA-binding MarR family transcriptional regulator
VKVVITDEGWEVANRLNPVVQGLSRETLSCLSKEQVETLVGIMRILRENLLPKVARNHATGSKRHEQE